MVWIQAPAVVVRYDSSSHRPSLPPPHPPPTTTTTTTKTTNNNNNNSLGAEVTGLDPSPANIDVARRHAAVDPLTQNIRYEAAAVEEFIGAR